jgi:hypothetical protein
MQVQEAEAAEAVTAYSFEDMLDRKVEEQGVALAFNIHVPKAAGGTVDLLFEQNDFQIVHFDMASSEFFATISDERRLLDGYRAPAPRPHSHLLTGHFRLDHPIFRRIGVAHFTVTTLRDPIDRMLSNYNHALITPGGLWHEEVASGRMPIIEHVAKVYAAVGPQYSFFDDTGRGTFAPRPRHAAGVPAQPADQGQFLRIDQPARRVRSAFWLSHRSPPDPGGEARQRDAPDREPEGNCAEAGPDSARAGRAFRSPQGRHLVLSGSGRGT